MLGLPEGLAAADIPESAVRLSILVPVVAAELGISVDEAERRVRELCADALWPVEEVGHA